jgi:hypothetical protein
VFAVVFASMATASVWRVRRRGDTVRGSVLNRRRLARAAVDSPAKLHARAPVGAGMFALASFPAVFLALATAPRAGGLDLPPTADARVQLWCIAAVALVAVVAVDGWLGLGVSARALAADRFTAAVVGCTIALAATPSLMVFDHVHAREAWLTVAVAQFVWSFGGLFLCGAVSERRKRQLWRADERSHGPRR